MVISHSLSFVVNLNHLNWPRFRQGEHCLLEGFLIICSRVEDENDIGILWEPTGCVQIPYQAVPQSFWKGARPWAQLCKDLARIILGCQGGPWLPSIIRPE